MTQIEFDAFADCPDLVIYGEKGSYAEEYAKSTKIRFFDGNELYDPFANVDTNTDTETDTYSGRLR